MYFFVLLGAVKYYHVHVSKGKNNESAQNFHIGAML